ncbi:MAG: hypothetical protein WC683_02075 [bacterium]
MAETMIETCADPGKKRRSGGAGRGLATGKGEGPIGVPVGKKKSRGGRFVRAEDLAQWTVGSLEEMLERAEASIRAAVGVGVDVIATQVDPKTMLPRCLFQTPDGALHEAHAHGDQVDVRPSAIPVFEEAQLPGLVREELRALVAGMMQGTAPERTRVRAVAGLLRPGEPYTLGAALRLAEAAMDATDDQHWWALYEANQERIRTKMWGSIRELEAAVPHTAYAKLPRSRLPEFDGELRESVGLLAGVCGGIVDEIRDLVFDGGRDDDEDRTNGAIRESLLVEAQTLYGVLAKVDQLWTTEDIERMAEAHDQWAGRARVMKIVAAYLVGRAQKGAEAST